MSSDNLRRGETIETWRQRTGCAEHVDKSKPATIGVVMGAIDGVCETLAAEIKSLRAEISSLKARLVEIERKGVQFMGTHQRAMGYPRGAMTVLDGSTWAAVRDVAAGEIPGRSDGWQLAAKRGQDGRDAKGSR